MMLQMAFFSLHMLFGIRISFNMFKLCIELFHSLRSPLVFYLIHAIVLYTLAACLWVISRQLFVSVRSTRRLNRQLDTARTQFYSRKYLLQEHELMIIHNVVPIALTLGIIRPRIILSTALLELLEEDELQAVLEHERFHLKHRDPLAIFLLSMLAISMWYIPLYRWVLDKYKIIIEIMADQFALSRIHHVTDLGGALIKMLKQGQAPHTSVSYASFAETSINVRILHILEPQTKLSLRMPFLRTVISILALLILVTFT
ncbi:M56 family metallopeptidase [Paenibacillus sp. N3.4]|uniref:M56 family metallopeptidase n=1 Tax=Paenibacillus sp. N3.4 TaxID=2603222 RepID=UPI00164EF637|nr:M56 family metallopeptidase [Paenibacillus sp. N3.4]